MTDPTTTDPERTAAILAAADAYRAGMEDPSVNAEQVEALALRLLDTAEGVECSSVTDPTPPPSDPVAALVEPFRVMLAGLRALFDAGVVLDHEVLGRMHDEVTALAHDTIVRARDPAHSMGLNGHGLGGTAP